MDQYSKGEMINGVYYLAFDKDVTVKQIHDYIFEDKNKIFYILLYIYRSIIFA